jgi:hypothetical protein
MPIHGGLECHAIKPRRGRCLARKLWKGSPSLEQDFLSEVLTFVAGERVSARHLHDRRAMFVKPGHELRVLVFVEQCTAFVQKYWYNERALAYKKTPRMSF